jgi:hypothetical protein
VDRVNTDTSIAVQPTVHNQTGKRRKWWLAVLLWSVFASGLLVQVSAPRLKIQHNAFVLPPALLSGNKTVDPAEIVAREKRRQLLSGLLTLGGAVGLGFYYRKTLLRRHVS